MLEFLVYTAVALLVLAAGCGIAARYDGEEFVPVIGFGAMIWPLALPMALFLLLAFFVFNTVRRWEE